jgi:hypothetical protein
MPGKNFYTPYKGYKIHYPLAHDLLKASDGQYAVYVVLSRPWSSNIERFVVPGCFAPTLLEVQRLSLAHAKHLIDRQGQGPLEPASLVQKSRQTDEHAG